MPFPHVKCPGPDKVTGNLKATVSVQYAVGLLGEGSPHAKVPQTQLKYVELSKDKGNKAKGKEDKAAPGVPGAAFALVQSAWQVIRRRASSGTLP